MTVTTDAFTRGDSASDLGTTPDGHAWTNLVGAHGISTNRAWYDTGAGGAISTINVGSPTQLNEAKLLTVNNMGLSGRVTDATNMYLTFEYPAVGSQLFKYVAGSYTQLGANAGGFSANDIMAIDCQGTTIRMLKNGSEIRSATDSSLTTGNSAGFYTGGVSDRFYDDFSSTYPGGGTTLHVRRHQLTYR